MYFSQGKTEQKNHYYFYYKHKTNEKMLDQTTPYLLGIISICMRSLFYTEIRISNIEI